MQSEIKVIDYLIENGAYDTCSKCIYCTPIAPNGDVEPCEEFEKHGNTACRTGMIEYFKNNE